MGGCFHSSSCGRLNLVLVVCATLLGFALALEPHLLVIVGKVIIDDFPETDSSLLGGGASQAAWAARVWGNEVGLVAPVGADFPGSTHENTLRGMGVDTSGVHVLAGCKITPRETIRYEGEKMIWIPGQGWDRWEEILRTELPTPAHYKSAGRACHVLVEGPGYAEIDMTNALAEASLDPEEGLGARRRMLVSAEPVLNGDLTPALVRRLAESLRCADIVSPDWDAVVASLACLRVQGEGDESPAARADSGGSLSFRDMAEVVGRWAQCMFPEEGVQQQQQQQQRSTSGVIESSRRQECRRRNRSRVVCVRKGANGSFVWCSQDPHTCWHVPAAPVDRVVDPTGAGNAFCGALVANLVANLGHLATTADDDGGDGCRGFEGGFQVEDVLRAAARASATGAAVVAVAGLPGGEEEERGRRMQGEEEDGQEGGKEEVEEGTGKERRVSYASLRGQLLESAERIRAGVQQFRISLGDVS